MRRLDPEGPSRPHELKALIAAEREGLPFIVYRDGEEVQRILLLDDGDERVVIGRAPTCDVVISWDDLVSRQHAQLERVANRWTVADDGLSSNGTFVAGERVNGRKRMRNGDVVVIGETSMEFHEPGEVSAAKTRVGLGLPTAEDVTPMQKKVLIGLCRPLKRGGAVPVPASNKTIAEELVLSVEAIKTHLKALYPKFGLEGEEPSRKRAMLAERAMASGIVTERDL